LQRRPPDIVFRRAAMSGDECARIDPAAGVIPIARPDKRRGELAHLEMQMRRQRRIGRARRADHLAFRNARSLRDGDVAE